MKIVAVGSKEAFDVLKSGADDIEWIHLKDASGVAQHSNANAVFMLNEEEEHATLNSFAMPVFVNSVSKPLDGNSAAVRFNGWSGFIKHNTWEIAGNVSNAATLVLTALNKKYIVTADEPGFISARIIAMIINEAWYALGDGISTEAEIDTAMKLGTNYPYGPFEWGHIIGMKKVYELLQQMAKYEGKYSPAPRFQQFIQAQ